MMINIKLLNHGISYTGWGVFLSFFSLSSWTADVRQETALKSNIIQ